MRDITDSIGEYEFTCDVCGKSGLGDLMICYSDGDYTFEPNEFHSIQDYDTAICRECDREGWRHCDYCLELTNEVGHEDFYCDAG